MSQKSFLYVKNWHKYQHYKQRSPPWIKLHKSLLNDMEFMSLPPVARSLLIQLWILASEDDGKLTADLNIIRFRLRWDKLTAKELNVLLEQGFISYDASVCLQEQADAMECLPRDRDRVRGEKENKQPSSPAAPVVGVEGEAVVEEPQPTKQVVKVDPVEEAFERFWAEYPRKVGKGAARAKWNKLKEPMSIFHKIMEAISWQKKSESWTKDGGQYIPHPATYLQQHRWEDQPQKFISSEPKHDLSVFDRGEAVD